MVVCEKCEGKSYVVESRSVGSTVRRRRACVNCNWRWRTIEIDIDAFSNLNETIKKLGTVRHGQKTA